MSSRTTDLLARRHWIFDLDGTLTHASHDFDALRAELSIPPGVGLLEWMDGLPADHARRAGARIAAWEAEHAELARPQADAVALLEHLLARGAVVGVLTRNTAASARRTLEVCGLHGFFAPAHCIGRDDAAPKPSPAGIERLLRQWGAAPADAVMVGDWVYDLLAGRSAGVATVLVDRDRSAERFAEHADRTVRSLDELWSRAG